LSLLDDDDDDEGFSQNSKTPNPETQNLDLKNAKTQNPETLSPENPKPKTSQHWLVRLQAKLHKFSHKHFEQRCVYM
jgi:hypothetical protein